MAGKSAILTLKILGDAKDAQKALDDSATGLDKFQSGVGKLATPALGVVAAVGLIGKQAIDSASELQQSMGGIEAVFGDAAGAAEGFADKSAETVGLAKSEYGNLATVIGAQLKNAGTPIDELAGKTDGLITTGSDLAATFGGTTADAVGALSSALKGEMDPIEKYGITLNAAAIEAKRAEEGTSDLTGAAGDAAKQQAILALITEQSADAQGQFGREIDSVAGQQQVANAKFEDAKAALGTALLPAVSSITSKFADMAGFVSDNATLFVTLGVVVASLAGSIVILNMAFKAYEVIQRLVLVVQKLQERALIGTRIQLLALSIQTKIVSAATKAYAAVQWLLNAAMSANPMVFVVIAIIALVAAIIWIATKTTWFQDIWEAVWKAIQAAAAAVWNWITGAAEAAFKFIANIVKAYVAIYVNIWNTLVAAVAAVWDWIVNAVRAALAFVVGIIKGYIAIYVSIFEGIKDGVGAVWEWLKDAATKALDAILKPIEKVKDAFKHVVDAIRDVIDWLAKIKIPDAVGAIGDFVGGIFGKSAPAPAGMVWAPTAQGFAVPNLSASAARAGGSGVTVVVQGALDPVAVARQIRLILRNDNRRTNGVVIR